MEYASPQKKIKNIFDKELDNIKIFLQGLLMKELNENKVHQIFKISKEFSYTLQGNL